MKSLKKLALVSAMIAASSSAFAMEAMDEEALAAATGQDGLVITLDVAMTGLTVKWIDRDGTGIAGFGQAGGVIIDPVDVNIDGLRIEIDAGGDTGDATGDGLLHIAISDDPLGTGTVIGLDGTVISVADADNAGGSATSAGTGIISFALGSQLAIAAGMTLDIELGNEVNNFATIAASIPNLSLSGLTINDANSGGVIAIGNLAIDALNVAAAVNVTADGLVINTTGTTIGEVGLENVRLGTDAASHQIGSIYIQNLTANNVITVSGK